MLGSPPPTPGAGIDQLDERTIGRPACSTSRSRRCGSTSSRRGSRRDGAPQVAQRVRVELRMGEAAVAGEAAALHLVDRHHLRAAACGDRVQLVGRAHLARAAHRVDRDHLRRGSIRTRGSTWSWTNSMLSSKVSGAPPRREPAPASGTCRGWCRRRSASGRRRSPRAAPPPARPTCVGRRGQPLALERLAAAQAGQARRIDDLEAGLAEQRSAVSGSAPASSSPRCGPMLRAAQLGK